MAVLVPLNQATVCFIQIRDAETRIVQLFMGNPPQSYGTSPSPAVSVTCHPTRALP